METKTLFRLTKFKGFCLCIFFYVISLSMNGMYVYARGEATSGLTVLLLGWLGIFDCVLAWYANPCLFFSLVLLFKFPTASRKLALLGFVVGASALGIRHMVVDESGSQEPITLGAAYFIWLACFPIAYLAGINAQDGDA